MDHDVCNREHDQKVVDLNSEPRIEDMLLSLEILNARDFTQECFPLIKQENVF